MKLIRNLVLLAVAAGLGLGLGYILRGKHAAESAESPAMPASSAAQQGRAGGRTNAGMVARARDDSPLATKLERDLSMSSGVTHWLFWFEALEHAVPADMPRLARLARGNSTATRLVAARWIELNPRHFFDTLVAAAKSGESDQWRELARMLFDEWPKRDPEAVIAALSGLEDFAMRHTWRTEVVDPILQGNAELGLRVMSDWHIDNYGPRMGSVAKWAAADPRHAAEFVFGHPAGYASTQAMETIGKTWAEADPAHALEFAAAHPGELGTALATAAMKTWAGRNLEEAGNWLVGTDSRTRNHLSSAFVQVWAKQDAGSALTWCEANLTGSALAQAVGGVVKGAAEKDLAAAASLVTGMNPSPARAEAAVAVAEKWFPGLSSGAPVKPETSAWLAGLDSDSLKRVLDRFEWQWATSDPKSMAAFLATSGSQPVSVEACCILARQMARQDPGATLAWASRLPATAGLAAGGDAFAEWRQAQPEAATKWLNGLPAGDARRQPYFEKAIQMLAYAPQATEQLAAFGAAERTTARGVIEGMSIPPERRNQLLQALERP